MPDKLLGVIMMGLSIVVLFLLPWLDRCKGAFGALPQHPAKLNIAQFVVCFIILGVLGVLPSTPTLTLIAQLCTLGYFGFFVLLFFYSKNENTKAAAGEGDIQMKKNNFAVLALLPGLVLASGGGFPRQGGVRFE